MAETSIKRRVARVILVLGALTCVVFGLAVAYLSTDAFLEPARVTALLALASVWEAELGEPRWGGNDGQASSSRASQIAPRRDRPLADRRPRPRASLSD